MTDKIKEKNFETDFDLDLVNINSLYETLKSQEKFLDAIFLKIFSKLENDKHKIPSNLEDLSMDITDNVVDWIRHMPIKTQIKFFGIVHKKYEKIDYETVSRAINSAVYVWITNQSIENFVETNNEIIFFDFSKNIKMVKDELRYLKNKENKTSDELILMDNLLDELWGLIETNRMCTVDPNDFVKRNRKNILKT